MSEKITLEDFVTSWINGHLQPQKRQEIKAEEISEWKLKQ